MKKSAPYQPTPQPQESFALPPGVSSRKEPLGDGWAYVFRHTTLGLLGHLVLQDRGGQCHVSCEVAGDPADPMTQRLSVLQPLTLALVHHLEGQTGGPANSRTIPPPPPRPAPGEWVESKNSVRNNMDNWQ